MNLTAVNCELQAAENDSQGTKHFCTEFELDTSNGLLNTKNLQNHLVECENDLETISFNLILNESDDEKSNGLNEFLSFLSDRISAFNTQLAAVSKPLIPFDTGTTDQMKKNWYHLHRD